MTDEQIPNQPHPSPAKAAIAQQKPRDEHGRFLSGEELNQYRAQQQAVQFEAQRQKMNAIFGRSSAPVQGVIPGQIQQQAPQSNFQAILNANKPGAANTSEADKWDTFLGKRKSNLNNRW